MKVVLYYTSYASSRGSRYYFNGYVMGVQTFKLYLDYGHDAGQQIINYHTSNYMKVNG